VVRIFLFFNFFHAKKKQRKNKGKTKEKLDTRKFICVVIEKVGQLN
jgi:hypothetical protein